MDADHTDEARSSCDVGYTYNPVDGSHRLENPVFLCNGWLKVTIRHGDRSAIHALPGARELYWECLPYPDDIKKNWEHIDR